MVLPLYVILKQNITYDNPVTVIGTYVTDANGNRVGELAGFTLKYATTGIKGILFKIAFPNATQWRIKMGSGSWQDWKSVSTNLFGTNHPGGTQNILACYVEFK